MKITTILIIILLTGCSQFSQKIEEQRQLYCEESSSTICAAGFETND
jgi:hypothetical protein